MMKPDTQKLVFRQLISIIAIVSMLVGGVNAQTELTIEPGNIVSIEYSLWLGDGSLVASNVDQTPLVYEAGGRRVLPGLDRALMGLKAGDTTEVVLSPSEGYGPVRPDLLVEVDLASLPEDSREVGSVLVAQDSEGVSKRVIVREVRGEFAILDYNHPFAGQEIRFSIKVIDVN